MEEQVKQLREKLKATEDKLRLCQAVFENTNEGVMITDSQATIIAVNGAFTTITGYLSGEVLHESPRMFRTEFQDPDFFTQMWESLNIIGQWQGEIINRRKDGTTYPSQMSIHSVKNEQGEITHYVSVFSDISIRKDTEEFFKHIAGHDPLTNLLNRSGFYQRLFRAVYQCKMNDQQLAVMYIDLDNFKAVNDNYGHDFGDFVLRTTAERLRDALDQDDLVARTGGDEFIIVLRTISGIADVTDVGKKIVDVLNEAFSFDEQTIAVTASIGISIFPDDGEDPNQLLKNADKAMYHIKKSGKNDYNFYRS